MRHLVIIVALSTASASFAVADDARPSRTEIRGMLDSTDTLVAALADPVRVRGVVFADDACGKQFAHPQLVRGDARKVLAECLLALHPRQLMILPTWIGATTPLYAHHSDVDSVLGLEVHLGRIVSIGGIGSGRYVNLPSFERIEVVTPTDATRAAIDQAGSGFAAASIVVCHGAKGEVTARTLVGRSSVRAYDQEVVTHFAGVGRVEPTRLGGTPVAACDLVLATDKALPPPPPPPPPLASDGSGTTSGIQTVAPTMLEAKRIAGDRAIPPDDATKVEIARAGNPKTVGSFKLCVDEAGSVTHVSLLKSTGHADYDAKIRTTILRTWTYKPFETNGTAVPVCTAVTFIYSQH